MVILIVTGVKVSEHNFVPGQEYSYEETTSYLVECNACGNTSKYEMQLGYVTIIDGLRVVVPADNSALIKKDTPDEDMSGYWSQHRKAATDDFVVFDGDYVKAIEDRFDIRMRPKDRPDQADYDQTRLQEALSYNKNLLKEELIDLSTTGQIETPIPSSIIGKLIIGTGIIQEGHSPIVGEFIIGYDTIQSS